MNNQENEKVVKGKWVATIRTQRDRVHSQIRRKVVSNGIHEVHATNVMNVCIEKLREGKEVRFFADGKPVFRLYHCMDVDFTEMLIAAQAMGDLRSCCRDIGFEVVRKDELNADDIRKERAEMVKERDEAEDIDEVTPDTIVKCPKCGNKFRVGKALAR